MFPNIEYIFVYYFVMIHIPVLSNYIHNPNYMSKSSNKDTRLPFYLKVPTSVTAVEGADVILSCRIENLNDQMVFWIRNSDLQILTAGLMTFSSDPRFRVNHENTIDEKDWSLLISNVKIEDGGLYECQINTEPKMKLNIKLKVLVKELTEMMEMDSPFHHHFGASIEGKNLNVLKRGQTITLTCKVIESDAKSNNENSKHIEWIKDGEPVSSTTRNSGTTIHTIWDKTNGISKLTLSMLQTSDEGNYSCTSNGYESDVVTIQIVPDMEVENTSFIVDNSSSTQTKLPEIVFYFICFIGLFVVQPKI
ncbi:hypothetical protein PVAND_011522 [Polypedilum vanderplanki]|uniref:Ig-like domain-containing protein n=1 Tax=Polypedilum vanderplanki TaxID=319348 RepID=A0A9J6CKN6_POLVA|nr:hypothetical protein PVAND_011522 [Polypedilum vanderplanki]